MFLSSLIIIRELLNKDKAYTKMHTQYIYIYIYRMFNLKVDRILI